SGGGQAEAPEAGEPPPRPPPSPAGPAAEVRLVIARSARLLASALLLHLPAGAAQAQPVDLLLGMSRVSDPVAAWTSPTVGLGASVGRASWLSLRGELVSLWEGTGGTERGTRTVDVELPLVAEVVLPSRSAVRLRALLGFAPSLSICRDEPP